MSFEIMCHTSMNRPFLLVILLATLLLALLPTQPIQSAPRCFPEEPAIQHCIDDRFVAYWQQQGGLPVFGYPLSAAYEEQTSTGMVLVQLFERAKLEYHPENPAPFTIQLSHLGRQLGPSPASPQSPQAGCLHFAQTGQNICEPFLSTWRSYGLELGTPGISEGESLALFGLPLTPARPETLGNGQTITVQWFERARFEDHGNQGVLLGLLGRELVGDMGVGSPTVASAPSDWHNPTAPHPPGAFVEVAGSQLTIGGNPIRLKGVNYYPQGLPWVEMWDHWNGPQMAEELRLARDQLGINAVRILVPYGVSQEGIVDDGLIERVQNMSQIAADLDLRLIITLFDFYDRFPDPGSSEEQKNIRYLERFLGNFVGDERIIAWDLHNEPDNYGTWRDEGQVDQVLTWLGRMADVVHRVAPHHLVTVGMAHYENLLIPGPDGRRVIDYSDLISVHTYNAADAARQIDVVHTQTTKPIIIEEFGWPSGPPCSQPDYTETQQAQVYQQVLQSTESKVAGFFAWTLRDYDSGPTMRWDSREEHFGLYRPDGSLKPAADSFRAYAAPALPGISQTNYPHVVEKQPHVTGERSPMFIGESGHYIKRWFRRAWEHLGGRGTFGLPLSEAFVRPEDGGVVQYFEAAVLEFHEGGFYDADFDLLSKPEQTMRVIHPAAIGYAALEGRSLAPPSYTPIPNTRYFPDTGYTVQGDFWSLYENLLGPWRFGAALSSEFTEQVGDKVITVQYFERGRIEYHPETHLAQPGQLGLWAWQQRCGR